MLGHFPYSRSPQKTLRISTGMWPDDDTFPHTSAGRKEFWKLFAKLHECP